MIVTVYTAGRGCQRCIATTRRMKERGIEFTEVQLDAFTIEAAKFLGMSTAPIVVVQTHPTAPAELYWDGYRPDRIDALVAPAEDAEHAS